MRRRLNLLVFYDIFIVVIIIFDRFSATHVICSIAKSWLVTRRLGHGGLRLSGNVKAALVASLFAAAGVLRRQQGLRHASSTGWSKLYRSHPRNETIMGIYVPIMAKIALIERRAFWPTFTDAASENI